MGKKRKRTRQKQTPSNPHAAKKKLWEYVKDRCSNLSRRDLVENAVDSTALTTVMMPAMAVAEMVITYKPLTLDQDISARLLGSGLCYAGIGFLFGAGRMWYLDQRNITKESSEAQRKKHDIAYTIKFTAAIQPPFYVAAGLFANYAFGSGEHLLSWSFAGKVFFGTIGAAAAGLVVGWPSGYCMDLYRNCTGLPARRQFPDWLARRSQVFHKAVLGMGLALGVAATTAVWNLATALPWYENAFSSPQVQSNNRPGYNVDTK